ncbi:hypothetical protein ACPCG0_11055 [Propionibacteriaceae bacterium Y1923]|uniref:hypothetical protein n=1 Tax=Aestuariimicrobium sp. Y1814 TaxID=3418742 RepID=UPI003C204191
MTPHDPAEVDRRFREMIRTEFAEEVDTVDPTPTAPPPPDVDDDDPDPFFDESYREVDEEPHTWSHLSLLGFVLFGGGLAGMFAMLFGIRLGAPWAQVALAATIAGLVVLMAQALRTPASEDDDNGARL